MSRRAMGGKLVFCTILTLCISMGITLPLDSLMFIVEFSPLKMGGILRATVNDWHTIQAI
jgi:hypothetical protein